jgi:hypothetical protein
MPAGSGPVCSVPVTSGSITTTSNAFTIVTGTYVVSDPNGAGLLVACTLYWTPSAAQTITCKLYQGSGVTGTQVGPAAGQIATASGTTEQGQTFEWVDSSAFANVNQAVQYTFGFTASTGTGTVAYAFTSLEALVPFL